MAEGDPASGPGTEGPESDQADIESLAAGLRPIESGRPAGAGPGPGSTAHETAADLRARLLLGAAVLGYVALFLYWSFRQYDGHAVTAFDLGVFDQGIWLLSRFKRPFVTVNGRHLFGDHTSFILVPFAVVYRVLPSPKVLLSAQTIALAAGAVPTFLLARERLRDELLAALLAVAYLLHPVVGWANLSEGFHPDAFEVPLVLFAFWFVLRRRWAPYWLCVAALLLVKEDVALLTFALGVYVAVCHHRRVGVVTCALSAVYGIAAFAVVIPAFLGAGTVYAARIPFGGPGGFLQRAVTDPGEVVGALTTRARGLYLWQLFAPLAFVAWWAPGVLAVALGPLAVNLASSFPYQFDVRYHYSTLILPVLVVATIFGVASGPRAKHRGTVTLVLVASLVCAYLWSPTPVGQARPVIADPAHPAVASFHRAQRLLPRDAVVSAHFEYLPQIAHREEIYMFPNPWRASYWGRFQQEGEQLPEADRVQYVFLPARLGAVDAEVLERIRGEFTIVYDEDGVRLYLRRA